MSSLLGIDLGTSSVKVVVFAVEGVVKGIGLAEYPILTPRVGYAEQDPEQWWRATAIAVREALDNAGHPEILGIGFSGQMHATTDILSRASSQMVSFGCDVVCRHGAEMAPRRLRKREINLFNKKQKTQIVYENVNEKYTYNSGVVCLDARRSRAG